MARRTYYLLERVGSPWRVRYLAFDPLAGPGGDLFLLQVLPRDSASQAATDQHLRVIRRLKGDSLPKVLELHHESDRVLIVSTWVEGASLADYLGHLRAGRRPPLSPGEALRLIRGLAHGVCHLHQARQIAHGDIQPANVIVTAHPSRLILIDFGSGWPVQETARRAEGDGQHRLYAAPELQTGRPVDGFLADQFAVSVLLFQLLTLEVPYGGLGGKAGRAENVAQARRALVPPSRLSQARVPRAVWDAIDGVTLRGLTLDPAERYPTRQAWLSDLFAAFVRSRLQPESPPTGRLWARLFGCRGTKP